MPNKSKRHLSITISEDHLRALRVYAHDHGYPDDIQEALRVTSMMGLSADPQSVEVTMRANAAYRKVQQWAMTSMRLTLEQMGQHLKTSQESPNFEDWKLEERQF